MKILVLISVVVAVALAAPTKDEEISGPKREKKSASYGPPAAPSLYGLAPAPASSYGSAPASSYGPAPIHSYGVAPSPSYGPVPSPSYEPAPSPSYGPASTSSSHGCGHAPAPSSPFAFYFSPAGHLPSPLHYRSELEAESHPWKAKMLAAQENHAQARSYGAYGPVAGSLTGGAAQAVAAVPALGLFPKANTGGCAVPLLLSCAPSIIKGQLLNSQPASYSAPVPAPAWAPSPAPATAYSYRTNLNLDSDSQVQLKEDVMQKSPEKVQLSDMERADQGANQKQMLPSDLQSNPAPMINQGLDQGADQKRMLPSDLQSNPAPLINQGLDQGADQKRMLPSDLQSNPAPLINQGLDQGADQKRMLPSDLQSNPAPLINQGLDQTLNQMHTLTPDPKLNPSENI